MALSDKSGIRADLIFERMLECVPEEERVAFEVYKDRLMGILNANANSKLTRTLKKMFMVLYDEDVEGLRLDTTKVIMLDSQMDGISIAKNDRQKLLRMMWYGVHSVMCEDDFSQFIDNWVGIMEWKQSCEEDE
jgi:hypothetical protein